MSWNCKPCARLGRSQREGLESVESQTNLHWLQDDVTNADYMRFVLGLPDTTIDLTANLSDSLIGAVLDSLYATAGRRKCVSSLRSLGAEPSLMDGLDRDEAFMVIVMAIAVEDHVALRCSGGISEPARIPLHSSWRSLLASCRRREHLDLGGPAFHPRQRIIRSLIGDAARVMEEFLKAPFPTTDIVMLAVGSGGIQRHLYFLVGSNRSESTIYHEMATLLFHRTSAVGL